LASAGNVAGNVDNATLTCPTPAMMAGVEVLMSVPQDAAEEVEALICELTSGQACVERVDT